jgi:mannose-6-phosphate isomerase-like protein (cupin superfamily)
MEKINLQEKFALFSDQWSPKIVAELNGQHVKLAKLEGEFEWHHHDNEDELFFVIKGNLLVHFRDRTIELGPGEMLVIPKGVEHKPEAHEEVHLAFFEPAGTLNTGENDPGDRTVAELEWI